ncbi:MAG: hypothetical protein ACRDPC_12195 [Solirubrobacteraceae bacterium]
MVVTVGVPTLVIPDEQTWAVSGIDPASLDAEPTFDMSAVRRVLAPERVHEALARPLAEILAGLPVGVPTEHRPLRYSGEAPVGRPEAGHRPGGEGHEGHAGHEGHDHGGHEGHGDDAGHDHGDMMAIVGEPSADGLVMEPIELRFGPIGTPLPGGLVCDVTLDGDVVAAAEVGTILGVAANRAVPDPLAPKAWELALALAHESAAGISAPPVERWTRLAAVEVERALSHTAWLRAFARVLAWPDLTSAATAAIEHLHETRLSDARRELENLAARTSSSRPLRWRTAGRGVVSTARARELGLRGPAARASGLAGDTRSEDPLYRRLGFEPVMRSEGDALARTLVRAAEAVAAVDLAAAALEIAAGSHPGDALPPSSGAVEGPRGPLRAGQQVDAPGERAALAAAGDAMVGSEWAAALAILASFDLSPWVHP